MASLLSILKTVLNLNHNCMHVTSCETATVTVHRFGETFEQTRIYVHARPYERARKLCPVCKKKCPGYDTKYSTESSWRAPNLNGVPVYICYQPQRVKCPEHGVRTEYIPWADGRSRFTADFSNEIAWMVCRMSRTAIALFEDIDWRTVGNCVKAAHDRIEPDITIRMHGLRRICVDETSYRKGFSYITVVYDMDRSRVVWIHEGSGLEIFRLFCEAIHPDGREKIEIVAGDGAKWIDTCTKEYFPMRPAASISSMWSSGPMRNLTRYGLPQPQELPASTTAGNRNSRKQRPKLRRPQKPPGSSAWLWKQSWQRCQNGGVPANANRSCLISLLLLQKLYKRKHLNSCGSGTGSDAKAWASQQAETGSSRFPGRTAGVPASRGVYFQKERPSPKGTVYFGASGDPGSSAEQGQGHKGIKTRAWAQPGKLFRISGRQDQTH